MTENSNCSEEMTEERDRIVRLLNLAKMLMPIGELYYVDLIEALKACVRNPDLHLDYAIESERITGKKMRGSNAKESPEPSD